MKKLLSFGKVGLLAAVVLGLSACSSNDENSADSSSQSDVANEVIKVGATPSPHAEILEQVQEKLAEEGYDLEIVEYNDYIMPNTALDTGELDANFFQHLPYLENYNEENGTDLVSAGEIHFEPLGIYAGKTATLEELPDGATVAIPNDPTNEARALLLLQAEGLITLKDGAGLEATILDIEDNPHNLQISEIEAAQVARSLQDVDIAVINGNYALSAGLEAEENGLAFESSDSEGAQEYANIIAVKAGNENSDAIQALIKAIESDEVREFINEKYQGSVVPLF